MRLRDESVDGGRKEEGREYVLFAPEGRLKGMKPGLLEKLYNSVAVNFVGGLCLDI